MAANGSYESGALADWSGVRERLRARGLRWTPQRRTLIDVLSRTDGHVTGAELIERCREIDPTTIPSTVYRTLDVLEELGLLRHSHGADGREEFHVQPVADARPPALHARAARPGRSRPTRLPAIVEAMRAQPRVRGRPEPPLDRRAVRRLSLGQPGQSPVGTPMMLKPPST